MGKLRESSSLSATRLREGCISRASNLRPQAEHPAARCRVFLGKKQKLLRENKLSEAQSQLEYAQVFCNCNIVNFRYSAMSPSVPIFMSAAETNEEISARTHELLITLRDEVPNIRGNSSVSFSVILQEVISYIGELQRRVKQKRKLERKLTAELQRLNMQRVVAIEEAMQEEITLGVQEEMVQGVQEGVMQGVQEEIVQ
ncbi:hypothetical protein BsWGS_03114 [Bradybaena similaris]